MNVRALVLTGFGINCDAETEMALNRANAAAERVHLSDIIARPGLLETYHILALPGGFSFGDDVASGRILANRLRYRLGGPMKQFINEGKLVIGICNGFQVMVKMGVLPMFNGELVQEVTLTHNNSGRFENRWVHLRTDAATRCVWLNGIERLELPIRHGEGKFMAKDPGVLARLRDNGQVAVRYVRRDGAPARGEFPSNPNGSSDDIAGICDPTGRVFGLMPHPEAFVDGTNHPCWPRLDHQGEGAGLQVFRNAVAHVKAHVA